MAGSGCVGEGFVPLAVDTGIPEDPFSQKACLVNWLAASRRQLASGQPLETQSL